MTRTTSPRVSRRSVTAARKLARANSSVRIEAVTADAGPRNIEALVKDCSLVLDGSDNFETRLLLNDACLKHGVPWIYGAVIGTGGCTFTILPGDGPCFRCVISSLPAAGTVPTTETARRAGHDAPGGGRAPGNGGNQAPGGPPRRPGPGHAVPGSLGRVLRGAEGCQGTAAMPGVRHGAVRVPRRHRGIGAAKRIGGSAFQVDPGRERCPTSRRCHGDCRLRESDVQ